MYAPGSTRTNGGGGGGIGPMLRQRLEEKKALKETTQFKINKLDAQLRKHLNTASNKSKSGKRENADEITARLKQMERQRTTTSLSLGDEKRLIREMESLERLKKVEVEISQIRNDLATYRDIVRETNEAISELESALVKVNLAERLGCSTSDLKERIFDCPASKMAHVIGKNGSTIAQIENKAGVQMEVIDKQKMTVSGSGGSGGDEDSRKIRLVGTDEAIDAAVVEIENITLAIEEDVKITSVLSSYLSSKRYAALEKIRARHPTVHIDLNPNNVVRIRGKEEPLARAKEEVLAIHCKRATLTITSKEVGLVVGKGGSNIQSMENTYDVSVNVEQTNVASNNNANSEATIEIIGVSTNVDQAHSILKNLIYENADVEEYVMCTSNQRNMFLDNQAAALKEIQAKVNEQHNQQGGVLLTFEKNEDGTVAGQRGGPSKLILKARRTIIDDVRKLVEQRIKEYDAGVIRIDIDASIVPKVIGKKGETIRKLEEECPGASFDVEKKEENNQSVGDAGAVVTIHAADDATREAAIKKIQEIIDNNQILKIDIDQSMIGQLLGEPGKALRTQISDEMGVWMGLSEDDSQVVVQGNRMAIEQAAKLVEQFIVDHFCLEVNIDPEDEQLYFAGGEKNILNTVERDFNVKTTFIRAKLLLILRGRETNVFKAKEAVEAAVKGGDGWYVARLSIPDKFKGIVVGRGGSNLTKMESDHEGLYATLLRTNNQLVLRSQQEEQVIKARQGIIKLLATISVTENMPISTFYYEKLSANNMMRAITDGLNVNATLEKTELKLRGPELDVKEAKARVVEKMTGKYITYMPLDEGQLAKLQRGGGDTFKTISDQTKASVSLDAEECAIKLEGSRTKVKKAKITLLKFLDFMLPGQFAKINIPKQSLRAVSDPALLADVSAESGGAGAYLWVDRDLGCIFVRASDPGTLSNAIRLFGAKKDESDKNISVIQLEEHEQWLVPRILGKGGSNINKIRKESGARIDLDKDELIITIAGEEEARQNAKQALDAFIDVARKECAFVILPAGAMNSFIGKGGANVRKYEEDYDVSIDRERDRAAIRVNGKEDAVASAVAAIQTWIAKWEEENASKTLAVSQDSVLSAIVGKGGTVIRAIEDETGCKIQVDRKTMTVTARGQNREVAIQRIQDIITKEEREAEVRAAERERQRKEAQAEAEAAQMRKIEEQAEEAAALAAAAEVASPDNENKNGGKVDSITASAAAVPSASAKRGYPSVPVGMSTEKKAPSIEQTKPDPHVTKAGSVLLDFLLTDGPWESETVQNLVQNHYTGNGMNGNSGIDGSETNGSGAVVGSGNNSSDHKYAYGSGGLKIRLD